MVTQLMCGIDLIYGHRLEELVEELAAQLKGRIGDVDALFEPATILVPGLALQTYLEQELSWQLGVTPNVEFRLLRSFLAECLPKEVTIQGVRRPVALLEREQLHHILVELFEDLDGARLADCEEVRAYLKRDDNPVAAQRRRYQLAKKLSQIFIEYSFSRSAPLHGAAPTHEMLLQRWRALGADGAKELEDTERWQQVLWWQIFGEGGLVEEIEARTKTHQLTLAQALGNIQAEDLRLPDSFYMVGFPYTARLFVEAIALFGERSKVTIFALSPTKKWIDGPPPTIEQEEQLLLRQWGSASLEQCLMWKERARSIGAVEGDFKRAPKTNLEAVQQDVIWSGEIEAQEECKDDKSLRFFECPSIKREVEIVANEIWTLLLKERKKEWSEQIRPDDIAVIIAGADQHKYQAQIEAVFKSFDNLPFTPVSLPLSAQSPLMEAAQLLLSLPFGRFTRQELLRLLVHPNIAGSLVEDEADDWQRWCEQLHILHGADKKELAHTYLGEPVQFEEGGRQYHWDLYSWEQGFQRAALGSFLSGEPSGVDSKVEAGLYHYEPLELPGTATESVARFATIGSSLIRDAR